MPRRKPTLARLEARQRVIAAALSWAKFSAAAKLARRYDDGDLRHANKGDVTLLRAVDRLRAKGVTG